MTTVAPLNRERYARRLEELGSIADGSVESHMRMFVHTDEGIPVKAAEHHREWGRIIEDADTYPYVVIVAPPASAKSSWFSIGFPSWEIGRREGNVRVGLVCNTAMQAYGFSRSVQSIVASPRFAQVYGVRPDYERGWTQNSWFTTGTPEGPNPTLLASGVGGPILGKRFDSIVLDDPTTWDEGRSEIVMEGQRHWLKTTLLTRFPIGRRPPYGKGTRMLVVLTRWGMRDIVTTLAEMGFVVLTMPSLGYWDKEAECPACGNARSMETLRLIGNCEHCDTDLPPVIHYGQEPLWPEYETREMLLEEQAADPLLFQLVKQGDPSALSGDMFDSANFQRGQRPPPEEIVSIVQFADTAGGKDQARGDYFALATVATTKDDDVWIMDMDRARYQAPEQEEALNRNYEMWSEWWGRRVDLVCIEDVNEGTALYQRMIRTSEMPLKAVKPVKDKTFRAIPLANAYKNKKVWHPEGERWVRAYELELVAFPNGGHDDMLDAAGAALSQSGPGPQIRVL